MYNIQEIALRIISGEFDISDEDLQVILETATDIYHNSSDEITAYETMNVTINGTSISINYSPSEPVMDDSVFDDLSRLFKMRRPANAFHTKVGSDVRTGKEKLPFVMGGLDELYENQTEQWIFKNGVIKEEVVIEDKLDGTSAGLVYENGELVSGYSRGNGTMGADITRHLRRMKSVPKRIKAKERLELRAEIVIPVAKWPALKVLTEKETGKEYKNPRNYTAGKMNSSVASESFFDVVECVITGVNNRQDQDVINNLEFVRQQGFLVVEYAIISAKDVNDSVLHELLFERRKQSVYEIDGVVLTVNKATVRNAIPKTSSGNNPAHSVKIKFGSPENNAETTVKKIHYELSKDGYAIPRVEIDPVELGGVTITFATGFNAGYIRDNNIGAGTIIQITRSGDVIPHIERIVSGTVAEFPDNLDEYEWSETGVHLVLMDAENNIEVIKKKVLSFFTALEVPKLKEASVSKLVEDGYVNIDHIIRATEADLKAVLGSSAGKSVYDGIKEKLNPVSLAKLAAASQTLGRGIGSRKIQRIIDRYDTINVTLEQLLDVEGFEDKTATLFVNNLTKFDTFLEHIQGYFTIEDPNANKVSDSLSDVVAILTGFRDKNLEKLIISKGGKIGSSVGKTTTVLICADVNDDSSKIKKADQLGIEKITSEMAYERFSD